MQLSLFDGKNQFKIDKPIRLIELFAGIGAQAKALERLGADFQHYKMCEIDKYAVKSYNAIHGTNFEPSDITKIKEKDLEIVDTDKYCYIMTYSFPCTDLSSAGKMQGMAKGSGTRSGLLWEVERILKELHGDNKPLPQVLLMENVPEVIGKKNIKHFSEWVKTLDELGYKSKWQLLNAKDYEIPQNRNRCFMVSILGDYYYEFPQPKPLKLRLKDMLEYNVDEKYYLSNKTIDMFVKHTENQQAKGNGFKFEPTSGSGVAHSVLTRNGERPCDNFIKCEQIAQITDTGFTEMTGRVYSQQGLSPSIRTFAGGNTEVKVMEEPKIIQRPHGYNQGAEFEDCPSLTVSSWQENNLLKEPIIYDDYNGRIKADQSAVGTLTTNCGNDSKRNGVKIIEPNYRIRKLTPKECWRLMDFDNEDFYRAAYGKEIPCELAKRVELRNLVKAEWKILWRYLRKQEVSNSQLYKQAGNSIVVAVLMALFNQML